MRLALSELDSDIAVSVEEVANLIQEALASRTCRMTEQGILHSTPMENFEKKSELARTNLEALSDRRLRVKSGLQKSNEEALEAALASLQEIRRRIESIRGDFESSLQQDRAALEQSTMAQIAMMPI